MFDKVFRKDVVGRSCILKNSEELPVLKPQIIATKGGGSGFNLRGASKLPSLQTSKLPKRGVPEKACFGTMAKTE